MILGQQNHLGQSCATLRGGSNLAKGHAGLASDIGCGGNRGMTTRIVSRPSTTTPSSSVVASVRIRPASFFGPCASLVTALGSIPQGPQFEHGGIAGSGSRSSNAGCPYGPDSVMRLFGQGFRQAHAHCFVQVPSEANYQAGGYSFPSPLISWANYFGVSFSFFPKKRNDLDAGIMTANYGNRAISGGHKPWGHRRLCLASSGLAGLRHDQCTSYEVRSCRKTIATRPAKFPQPLGGRGLSPHGQAFGSWFSFFLSRRAW